MNIVSLLACSLLSAVSGLFFHTLRGMSDEINLRGYEGLLLMLSCVSGVAAFLILLNIIGSAVVSKVDTTAKFGSGGPLSEFLHDALRWNSISGVTDVPRSYRGPATQAVDIRKLLEVAREHEKQTKEQADAFTSWESKMAAIESNRIADEANRAREEAIIKGVTSAVDAKMVEAKKALDDHSVKLIAAVTPLNKHHKRKTSKRV